MAPQKNGTVLYALKGKSLEAALQLELEIRRELETVPVKNAGALNEIQDSWDRFYDGLILRLQKEQPQLLRQTGLDSPAPQVFQEKGGLPRAYRRYPEIFSSPEKTPRYFMYAPVDYRGNHFAPEDGVPVTGKPAAQVDDLLFAGGWLGNAPLVSRKKHGVALPAAEAAALSKSFRKADDDGHRQICFIAGGESLAAIEDFNRRTADYHARVGALREAIQKTVEAQFPDIMALARLPADEAIRASISYRYGGGDGKTEMLLSVRQEGRLEMMAAGRSLTALPENPAYRLKKSEGGEFTVKPRRDTAEGKALAALFDAIPATPALAEYKILHAGYAFTPGRFDSMLGVNGVVPRVHQLEGRTILVYNADDAARETFCPPGAIPLPTAAFKWLNADAADRNLGVTPPPMPPEIADIIAGAPVPAAKPQGLKP